MSERYKVKYKLYRVFSVQSTNDSNRFNRFNRFYRFNRFNRFVKIHYFDTINHHPPFRSRLFGRHARYFRCPGNHVLHNGPHRPSSPNNRRIHEMYRSKHDYRRSDGICWWKCYNEIHRMKEMNNLGSALQSFSFGRSVDSNTDFAALHYPPWVPRK